MSHTPVNGYVEFAFLNSRLECLFTMKNIHTRTDRYNQAYLESIVPRVVGEAIAVGEYNVSKRNMNLPSTDMGPENHVHLFIICIKLVLT